MTVEAILKYPSVFLVALLSSMLLTPLWQRLALKVGFLDFPGERKLHKEPIPVGGGVAVALAFHVACALIFLFPWQPFAGQVSIEWWLRFVPLSLGVLLLGVIDDRFDLRPLVKLAGQVLFALLAYALGIRLQNVLGVSVPEWVNFLGTITWFLVMMNAFNLIDGIDGLAAGIGMIAALGIGASLVLRESPGDVLLFVALTGACLGFLRYNFYPAKVFLGDAGSLFIGFTLAALSISTSSKGTAVGAIGMPLLAVGVPLFDTMLAIWRRAVRRYFLPASEGGGGKIRIGDSEHLHHRLLMKGIPQNKVALLLYGVTGALALLGVLMSIFHDLAIGILALGFVITAYTVFRHLAWIELQDSGNVVLRGIRRPERRNRTLLFYMVLDLLILNLAWLVSVLLLDMQDGVRDVTLKSLWIESASIDVIIPFLMLLLFRSYTRVWYLARVAEYAATGMAVLLGMVIAWAINHITSMSGPEIWPAILQHVVMAGIAIPAVVGVRAALRVVQDLMQLFQRRKDDEGRECERVAIWGAGYRTTLFLKQLAFASDAKRKLYAVGIFCEDEAMVGHFVHGVRVYGGLDNIRYFVEKEDVAAVYVVESVSESLRRDICKALSGLDVRVIQWDIIESECHA